MIHRQNKSRREQTAWVGTKNTIGPNIIIFSSTKMILLSDSSTEKNIWFSKQTSEGGIFVWNEDSEYYEISITPPSF